MSLAELQLQIQDYLLGNGQSPAAPIALLHLTNDDANDNANDRAQERLNIYHYAYRARLHEALGSIYERLWAYLGDEQFADHARRHIDGCPSQTKNLRDYGSGFSSYLQQALPDDPEVAELAVMEWHMHNAFDTPNLDHLKQDDLSALNNEDWQTARFRFHPSVALAVFEWNTSDIWHALDQEQPPPQARKLDSPVEYLFWRSNLSTHFKSFSPAEYLAIATQMAGGSFAEACDLVAKHHPDAVEQIGQWLQYWIGNEMLVGVDRAPQQL